MISSLFGASATGFYSLGLRVIALPSMMISGALSSVFLSRIPEALKSNTLPELMEDMTRRLAPASAYLYGTMAFFGPQLFTLVFGSRWSEAGYYVRFLSPWLAIIFVFSPQTTVVLARGRQGAEAIWQIGVLLVRLFGLYGPVYYGMGQRGAVACFGVASLVTSAAYYLWMLRVGGASLRRVAARIMADTLPVAGILGVGKLACAALNGSNLMMLATLATTGIVMRKRILGAWRTDERSSP
jgi:O-antigen/teichoic acid export membrane protein